MPHSGMDLRRAVVLALLATLAPAAVRADPTPDQCLKFSDIGCYYVPTSTTGAVPLLVYHRGHHSVYKGEVPPEKCLQSAQQAFISYKLGVLADSAQIAVLVICSSNIGIAPAAISNLSKVSGRVFSKNLLVSHSGGYVGLHKTLNAGVTADRIILLDTFYEEDDSIARLIQAQVSAGAVCTGYFTAHNKDKYENYYEPNFQCSVDDMGDNSNHDLTVTRCLPVYLTQRSCP